MPLAVVVKVVLERTKVNLEDSVSALGCGPVGLLAANAIKAEGAHGVMITGTDLDEGTRLKVVLQMNIDHILNDQHENIKEAVLSFTNGHRKRNLIKPNNPVQFSFLRPRIQTEAMEIYLSVINAVFYPSAPQY